MRLLCLLVKIFSDEILHKAIISLKNTSDIVCLSMSSYRLIDKDAFI